MAAPFTRRDLLKWMSAGAGAASVGGAFWAAGRLEPIESRGTSTPRVTSPTSTSAVPSTTDSILPVSNAAGKAAPVDQRVLVMIDMTGGLDGMSMVAPYGVSGYYDLRPVTGVPADQVLTIDDDLGWHPSLIGLHARGAAIIQGVGSDKTDGSHFEMQARWWEGSPNRTGVFDTGFLGRLADAIGIPDSPVTALSVSNGAHPTMLASRAGTLTVPTADASGYLSGAPADDQLMQRFQAGYRAFARGWESAPETARERISRQTISFTDAAGVFAPEDNPYGYGDDRLGGGLRMAAHLFTLDLGLRIVHITMDGEFDTHDGHPWRHEQNMVALNTSLSAFFNEIDERGLTDRVLVMTSTEFGRTAEENGSSGLDHGWANHHALFGPVNPGRYGEHPEMRGDDEQGGGFVPTVGLDSYFATIAEGWFGVPAGEVLEGNPEVLADVIRQ